MKVTSIWKGDVWGPMSPMNCRNSIGVFDAKITCRTYIHETTLASAKIRTNTTHVLAGGAELHVGARVVKLVGVVGVHVEHLNPNG